MNEIADSDREQVPPTLPRNVKILGGASLLNDVASEAIFPLLPSFLLLISPQGSRLLYLGLIEGVADSVASLLKLWSGGWSDRVGRRKGFVLFGYSLATVLRPLIGIIVAPWQLLIIRVGDRIGKGVRTSPRDALIADATPPSLRGRAFGFHRAMDHLGAAIGPLLAYGFLLLWPGQMRPLFLLTAIPGVLVLALLIFGLREPPAQARSRQPLRLTLRPFDRDFRLYLLSLVLFTLGNSSDIFLLERSRELGMSELQLLMLWSTFHIAKSTSNLLLGRAVDWIGPRPFLFLGWLVYAGIYLAFALVTSPMQAWIFFLSYAVFYGLTEPAEKTLVANLAGGERKGLAFGWYNFAVGIAALPASVIFGVLYQYGGAFTAFGWGAALALVAALLLVGVRERRTGETPVPPR
ncbi:MAG TPA: MFS transporter [Gemmataceae bacterium]|nr:MFS transporter [Gemmataceae bacterium]